MGNVDYRSLHVRMKATEMQKNALDHRTWDSEDRLYFEHVDEMLEKKRNVLIGNSQPHHAVYLINALLKNAQKTFRLFSGSLTQRHRSDDRDRGMPIYSAYEIIASACELLTKSDKSRLDIVLEEDIDVADLEEPKDHPLIKAILAMPTSRRLGTFRLHRTSGETIRRLQKADICNHLMIMDERAFRLETEHNGVRAFANFGDAKMARQFSAFYDDIIWKNSTELVHV